MATTRKKKKTKKSTKKTKRAVRVPMRILLTCVGRRVELIHAFRRAAQELKIRLEVHGADASKLAPAIHLVDKAHIISRTDSGEYIDSLINIVRRNKIDLLIPLIDLELSLLAESVARFEELRCRALISSEEVVRICRDKLLTYQALTRAGIDTPQTWLWSDIMQQQQFNFPYFLKPRAGSAAAGNYIVHNEDELYTFGRCVTEPIVQEFVEGEEYTLDVYTGFDGLPRCVVPRLRLEVRTGEVSKGLIVKNKAIMAIGELVAKSLGACRGVITVQCILTNTGRIRVIEINPRFGGGAPLAIHAGADFTKWILMEQLGKKPQIRPDGFRDDIVMLRYDESVFISGATKKCQIETGN